MKKTKKNSGAVKQASSNINEAVEFLMSLPEIQEAFTRADVELALDDRGWLTSGRGVVSNDLDPQTRTTLVAKSRLYWQRDPLAKQAVRLWTDYSLGSGITYQADDDSVQEQLKTFCTNRRNRSIMNSEGQRKSSKKLLVDGEIFFAIFLDDKTIRRVDPVQITDIICDPDDEEHVLGYKRVTASNKNLFYQDWKCSDEDVTLLEQQQDPSTKGKIVVEKDVVLYHVPFDSLGKRGNGLLFPVCDWSKEHRRFMEARVAIVQALSKFAWKTQVKGGQAIINQTRARLESTLTQTGPTQTERNPQNAAAANWLQNAGIDTTPMPRTTGAGDANSDGDQLKLMVSAGTGIMLHYFGDPRTGNLATATAMELPMLKMFQSYQKLWADVYQDIFSIILEEDVDEQPETIDIDLPPILAEDLQKLATFLGSATSIFPELKVREVLIMLLNSMGINNIDEVLKAVDDKRKEIDANVAAGKMPDGSPRPVAPGGPPEPAQESAAIMKKLTESFDRLAALLK